MKQSLNELREKFYQEDLLLEGTITLQVEVSIERHRNEIRNSEGHVQSLIDPRCLVTIFMPPAPKSDTTFFADGEHHMCCTLIYSGSINGNYDHITLDDVIKALDFNPDAKIWKARENP